MSISMEVQPQKRNKKSTKLNIKLFFEKKIEE